jgi:hypothetical protein
MGGAYREVLSGNAGGLSRRFADPGDYIFRHTQQVAHGHPRRGIALPEYQGVDQQRIMDPGTDALREISAHPLGRLRRNLPNCHPGLQYRTRFPLRARHTAHHYHHQHPRT